MSEFDVKQKQIKTFLAGRKLDALLLRRVSSFAWATCGASSYINTAVSDGTASLLITPKSRYLVTTNIEAPRFEKEEGLAVQGWEIRGAPWHDSTDPVAGLVSGMKLGADGVYPGAVDVSSEVADMRLNLGPEEQQRFRILSSLCAQAMDEAIRQVHPGLTEYEIAGLLSQATEKRGAQAIVNLIATDERIFSYRHPLPTGKKMSSYAMLVLCGRRWGLVCSVTRLVHFGKLPDELRRKQAAVAQIDATFLATTRPGQTIGDVFKRAMSVYAKMGFADEWRLHHQGGPAGYEPREIVGTQESSYPVRLGQTYAWNPSITGTKSEDTILVGEKENEVMTAIPGWPVLAVNVNGKSYDRPAILEV